MPIYKSRGEECQVRTRVQFKDISPATWWFFCCRGSRCPVRLITFTVPCLRCDSNHVDYPVKALPCMWKAAAVS
jgi:hypothetical protein